jgi:hypothetical protein
MFERGDDAVALAALEPASHRLVFERGSHLGETHSFGVADRDRFPAPAGECGVGVAARGEPLGAQHVGLEGGELVAAGHGQNRVGAQLTPQPRHRVVERLGRRHRGGLAPDGIDQGFGGDSAWCPHRERSEHGRLPPVDGRAVDIDGPQDSHLHCAQRRGRYPPDTGR